MNKAYIDMLDPEVDVDTQAVLLYIKGDISLLNNLLESKFPDGRGGEREIWCNGYWSTEPIVKEGLVVWFYDSIYSHENLLMDLEILGYNIVQLERAFDKFEQMVSYIEENKL